jgi:hypothetical protein
MLSSGLGIGPDLNIGDGTNLLISAAKMIESGERVSPYNDDNRRSAANTEWYFAAMKCGRATTPLHITSH